MSIAQQLVASEGQTRLAEEVDFLAPPGGSNASDLRTDVGDLKWLTLRAEHRAYHVAGISSRARAVLAALARTVDNARPSDKIFAGRHILQDRAMIAERTFFRALTDLADAGLITRHKQWEVPGRAGWNRAYLALTDTAIALLGFKDRPQQNRTQTTNKSAANDGSAQTLRSMSAQVADPIKRDLDPENQKRQPGQLPADLERLLDLGFSRFFIFSLMREARINGKRLSDVVEACWPNIKAARRPICYLRALLKSTFDFSYQVAAKRTEAAQVAKQAVDDALVQATVAAHAGGVFTNPDNTIRATISADGKTLTVVRADEKIPRLNVHGWQSWFVSELNSRNLVVEARVEYFSPDAADPRKGSSEALSSKHKQGLSRPANSSLASLKMLLRGPRFTDA